MTMRHPQSPQEPLQSVLTVAHLVDALPLVANVGGLVDAATVIGRFLGSLPSIAAVILNDGKRDGRRPPHRGRYPLSLAEPHMLVRAVLGASRLSLNHQDHRRRCYVCVFDR
jgi:hypothetical protein